MRRTYTVAFDFTFLALETRVVAFERGEGFVFQQVVVWLDRGRHVGLARQAGLVGRGRADVD